MSNSISASHSRAGDAGIESLTLYTSIKLALKRLLSTRVKRRIKTSINKFITWFSRRQVSDKIETISALDSEKVLSLMAGDCVRVRSKDEIDVTLDYWGELRGCGFVDEMCSYYGTTQRVFKRVERFVDERDYKVKSAKGVVLLEGVICQGTTFYGKCDRACFFFWREEWLEKIEKPPQGRIVDS